MKIDKVVFASSEEYSVFWNLQSEVWSKIGIEPVLLLWGRKSRTNVDTKYGTVVEMEYSPNAIKSLQMTWSKFHHTASEPNTTWLIGDIDLFPLQSRWFREMVESIPEDHYGHLAAKHLCPHCPNQWYTNGGSVNGGQDLPAYYHVAKGRIFARAYSLGEIGLVDDVNRIVSTGRYGRNIPQEYKSLPPEEVASLTGILRKDHANEPYWCADENYSSDMLWNSCTSGAVSWTGRSFDVIDWSNPYNSLRIDRHFWDGKNYNMVDFTRLKRKEYIDIHCSVPYADQESDLIDILRVAGMVDRC